MALLASRKSCAYVRRFAGRITCRRYGVPIASNPAARRSAGRDHSSPLLAEVAEKSRRRNPNTRTWPSGAIVA